MVTQDEKPEAAAIPGYRPLARVDIRPATPDDARLLREWRAEPSVRRHQPLHDVATSQLRADLTAQRHADLYLGRGERFLWIVEHGRAPAGWITLVVGNWEHGLAEIGYALSSAFLGRGLMKEALTLLLPDLFLRAAIYRLEARCAVDNVASQRVLEKLGFHHEGVLRRYFRLHGERVDHYLYALLRDDFLPRDGV